MKLNLSKCSWNTKSAIIALGGFAIGATGGAVMFGSFGLFASLGILKMPIGFAMGYFGTGIIMKPLKLKNKIQYFIEKELSQKLSNRSQEIRMNDELQSIDQKTLSEALSNAKKAIIEEYKLNEADPNWSKFTGDQFNTNTLKPLFENHISIQEGVEQISGDLTQLVLDQSFDKLDEQLDNISKCGRHNHQD